MLYGTFTVAVIYNMVHCFNRTIGCVEIVMSEARTFQVGACRLIVWLEIPFIFQVFL